MKRIIIVITILIINICLVVVIENTNNMDKKQYINTNFSENVEIKNKENDKISEENSIIIDDWRLTLVNYENMLPEDFSIELANIDNTRQFDARAIDDLKQMMIDMKKSGISNIWVQSAYRSIEYQTGLFNDKVNKYIKQGKTKEEAEILTLQKINRPGTSEHNLGLAVDFNYVDYSFEQMRGFGWLQENAENYGFILRYRKDKEDITKVDYEPWHWRYVGVENAKKINELDMCLEEYIEFLK